MYKILITTGVWQSSYCAMQSLARMGHKAFMLTDDEKTPFIRSKFCSGYLKTAAESDSAEYANELTEFIQEKDIDILFPMSDVTMRLVSRHKEKLGAIVKISVPDEGKLDIALNKARAMRFAEENGFLTPKTMFPRTLDDALRMIREGEGKIVLKTPYGTGGSGVFISDDKNSLSAWVTQRFDPENPIVLQEFIDGDFYDLMAICQDGKISEWFGFYLPSEYSFAGAPPYAFPSLNNGMYEYCRSFIEKLDWTGPIDFDFLRGKDGRLYLLEINPRLSGTTNFAYKLGVDLPAAYLNTILGKAVSPAARTYSDTVMYQSIYPALARWLRQSRKSNIPTMLANLVRHRSVSSIYWDDLPVLRNVAYRFVTEMVS